MTLFRTLLAVVATALLVAAGCGSSNSVDTSGTDSSTQPSLAGRWVLASVTIDGNDVDLPSGDALEMTIETGQIGGSGGCNSFGGSIDGAADGTLTLVDLAWTEMACADTSRMDFESTYLGALGTVNRWETDPDGITFLSDTSRLRYTPGAAPVDLPLEGTTWSFDTIFSGEGASRAASSTDQSGPQVDLVISDGAAVLSSEGCQDVTFALNHEGGTEGNLAFPELAALDAADCDNPNLTAAVEGLSSSTGYMIDESRLTLIGADGETIGFRAMA